MSVCHRPVYGWTNAAHDSLGIVVFWNQRSRWASGTCGVGKICCGHGQWPLVTTAETTAVEQLTYLSHSRRNVMTESNCAYRTWKFHFPFKLRPKLAFVLYVSAYYTGDFMVFTNVLIQLCCNCRRDDPRDAVVLRVDQECKDLSSLAPQRSVVWHCIVHFGCLLLTEQQGSICEISGAGVGFWGRRWRHRRTIMTTPTALIGGNLQPGLQFFHSGLNPAWNWTMLSSAECFLVKTLALWSCALFLTHTHTYTIHIGLVAIFHVNHGIHKCANPTLQ